MKNFTFLFFYFPQQKCNAHKPGQGACHAKHASQGACHALHATARHCTSKTGGPSVNDEGLDGPPIFAACSPGDKNRNMRDRMGGSNANVNYRVFDWGGYHHSVNPDSYV